MPVILGEKSPTERFPGALRSFSIEAMMQDGKALQAGTSHYLGQNFARAADIAFLDADGARKHVHTTSWGVSTRLIGGLVMTHSDDDGVCLPPRVAPHQVVVVPILRGSDADAGVLGYAQRIAAVVGAEKDLDGQPVRVHVDQRAHRAVEKRWQWIKKGAPLVVEVGPRDVANQQVTWRRRDESAEVRLTSLDAFPDVVTDTLKQMQATLLTRARDYLAAGTRRDIHTAAQAEDYFRHSDQPGFVLTKWCGSLTCEVALKPVGATIRCLPTDLAADTDRCLICGRPAESDAVFAQSY